MKFKKIEMYGFKSFADKLEIKFDDGVTGIVGPNGCGKSNVADSIRWVLGEQSAKSLRGNNMLDVIFNGTSTRKSLSYCEVSLVFDNSAKEIPLDYTDIIITRKLYRSGESEYLINRTPCRLKDIVELLRDMGIGKDGYSIIGQGKVDEIISSKPEDRRGIFEEACGISKFKARKIETERKLMRTHDNLLRLNDILSELARQLTPLEKQSADATKYLELKENLRYQDINTYVYQYESVNTTKAQIESKLSAIMEELGVKQVDSERANSGYDSCMLEIGNIDREITGLRDQQLELSLGLEKQSGEIRLIREKINFVKNNIERVLQQDAELENGFENTQREVFENEKTREQKVQELTEIGLESDRVSDQYLALVDLLTRGESDNENSQRDMVTSLERLSDIKADYSGLTAEKKSLLSRREGLKIKLDVAEREHENYIGQVASVRAQKAELIKSENFAQSEVERYRSGCGDLQVKYNLAEKKQRELNNRLTNLDAQQKMLSRIQDNFEAYQTSVRLLLSDGKNNRDVSERICGTVAHLMNVPKRYEVAVDVALGAGMQNVIVESEQDAKYLIGYLKQKRYGRITFLPVDSVRGRNLEASYERMASACSGYLGVGSDLVTFDEKYRNIYTGLLGRTLLCDTLDNATILARKLSYAVRIVTLDGDIIHPFGAMTGGSRKSESTSLLTSERELASVKADLADGQREMQELTAGLEKLFMNKQLAESALEKAQIAHHNRELDMATVVEKVEKVEYAEREKLEELNGYRAENYELGTRLDAIESDLKLVDELENTAKREKDTASSETSRKKEQSDRYRHERDELLGKITEYKVTSARRAGEIESLAADRERLLAKLEDIKVSREKLAEDRASLEAGIQEFEREADNIVVDSQTQRELDAIKLKLANLDTYKQDKQNALAEFDRRAGELSAEIQKLMDARYREENAIVKVDTDLEIMRQKILEDYAIEYEGALRFKDEQFEIAKSSSEINRLKRQISALGYVNINAIDDFKELRVRFDDMDTQRSDLEKAENDMRQIISELTEEMLDRFTRGFNEISVNFQRVFKELFGGGNAKLVLEQTEDGDPLAAGVEIVAEPPGKKLQSITLLSGGEKAMTAIAILFAILKMKPMPFCVLDEIEAALDDANTERFAKYLRKFSDSTQFIVITHKKPTMEYTNVLYGVTMEEKGVSKMVSVKLSEAMRVIGESV